MSQQSPDYTAPQPENGIPSLLPASTADPSPPVISDAQTQFFRRAHEALKAQWEETRTSFLTQHNAQYPDPPDSDSEAPSISEETTRERSSVPTHAHGAYGAHTPPPGPTQMRMILPVRAYRPIYGKPHTYPPLLKMALDQCAKEIMNGQPPIHGTSKSYYIVRSITSEYTPPEVHILATHQQIRQANTEVLKYFLNNHWNENMEEPRFEAMAGGRLRCEILMDGFMAAREAVYVSDDYTGAA